VPNGGMAFGHFYGDFGDQAVHRTGQHGIAFLATQSAQSTAASTSSGESIKG